MHAEQLVAPANGDLAAQLWAALENQFHIEITPAALRAAGTG